MMKYAALLAVMCFCATTGVVASPAPVPADNAARWLNWLIPLPQEIDIPRQVTMHPADVAIVTAPDAGEAELHAAERLRGFILDKTGSAPSGDRFTISLGVIDGNGRCCGTTVPGAERLAGLPNSGQSYIIAPNGDTGLMLAGREDRGVWYAATTLMQLLEPHLAGERIVVPLASVVDWPDMEERGLWNFSDPVSWIPWLSSLKLNYGKMVETDIAPIERGRPAHATINRDLMMKARLTGFNYCPFIMHYNFWKRYGLFTAYPELAGVGDEALSGRYAAHKLGDQNRAPNASHPEFTRLLADIMKDIASQGATEISCWLTERPAESQDHVTTALGQFVQEARATVGAWREARKTHPDLVIRLFISTTTDERYFRVLAETPPEVKIERCCASWIERIPREPRDIWVDPLFDSYADEGRWVATYDVPLGSYGRVDTPEFKIPCSSPHRIRDFVAHFARRGWRGAYGMMAWSNPIRKGGLAMETYGFNVQALAEWSWNLDGRSEREFVAAWATRSGYDDPGAVADWAAIMGPVEYDIFDSGFPIGYSWGKFTEMVDTGTRPVLGDGMFRYYRDPDDFESKIQACDRALAIAERFANPYLAGETRIARSYVRLARAVWRLADLVAAADVLSPPVQTQLRAGLDELGDAGAENVREIKAWRTALGPEPWHYRVHDAYKATERTVADITGIIEGKYMFK